MVGDSSSTVFSPAMGWSFHGLSGNQTSTIDMLEYCSEGERSTVYCPSLPVAVASSCTSPKRILMSLLKCSGVSFASARSSLRGGRGGDASQLGSLRLYLFLPQELKPSFTVDFLKRLRRGGGEWVATFAEAAECNCNIGNSNSATKILSCMVE